MYKLIILTLLIISTGCATACHTTLQISEGNNQLRGIIQTGNSCVMPEIRRTK